MGNCTIHFLYNNPSSSKKTSGRVNTVFLANYLSISTDEWHILTEEEHNRAAVVEALFYYKDYSEIEPIATSLGITQEIYNDLFVEYAINQDQSFVIKTIRDYGPYENTIISERIIPKILEYANSDENNVGYQYFALLTSIAGEEVTIPYILELKNNSPETFENSIENILADYTHFYQEITPTRSETISIFVPTS